MFMLKGINFLEIKGSNFEGIEKGESLYDFKRTLHMYHCTRGMLMGIAA